MLLLLSIQWMDVVVVVSVDHGYIVVVSLDQGCCCSCFSVSWLLLLLLFQWIIDVVVVVVSVDHGCYYM